MDRASSSLHRLGSPDLWPLEAPLASSPAKRARVSDERHSEQPSTTAMLLDAEADLHRLESKVSRLVDATELCIDANEQLKELGKPVEELQHTVTVLRRAARSRFESIEEQLAKIEENSSALLKRADRLNRLSAAEDEVEKRLQQRIQARAALRDAPEERVSAHDIPRDAYLASPKPNGVPARRITPETEAQSAARTAYANQARFREARSRRGTPENGRGVLQPSENLEPRRSTRESERRRSISPDLSGHRSERLRSPVASTSRSRAEPISISSDAAQPLDVQPFDVSPRTMDRSLNEVNASPSRRVDASSSSLEPRVNGIHPSPSKSATQSQPSNGKSPDETCSFPPLLHPLPPYWAERLERASFYFILADILRELAKRPLINAEAVHAELRNKMGQAVYYDMLDACWGTQRFLGLAARFLKISKLRFHANGIVLHDVKKPFFSDKDNAEYFSRPIDLTSDDGPP